MANLFFSGMQFIVAIIAAAIAGYLSVWLFGKATRGIDEWTELRKGNLAVGVILGAMIIGVGIVLRPALAPLGLNLDATPVDAVAYRILLHGLCAVEVGPHETDTVARRGRAQRHPDFAAGVQANPGARDRAAEGALNSH